MNRKGHYCQFIVRCFQYGGSLDKAFHFTKMQQIVRYV